MLLPWEKEYQIRTTATGLYRRIRASTEPARDRIGLDQMHETRQSWPGIPARRTARGNTERDRQCRSPMTASLSRARSWSVAMRRGSDGLGPDVYPRCTCRVPRMTCGLPRGRWVRRPLQEAAGQKSRVQFWHPTGTQRARRLLSFTTVGSSAPWSSSPPSDLRITRGMLPARTRPSCTDSTSHCIDDTRCAGITRQPGPRTGPRSTP
jgi:hypothetical protein